MVGLLAFGAMVAVFSGGARIAAERTIGWNRMLRLTPLTPRSYLRTKIITGYLMAIVGIVLLYAAGISLGVRLGFGQWVEMTALVLVALIPFAVLGIAMGHLLNDDAIGAGASAVGSSLFAFLGGTWFPITGERPVHPVLPAAAVVLAGAGGPRRARRRQPVGRQGAGW